MYVILEYLSCVFLVLLGGGLAFAFLVLVTLLEEGAKLLGAVTRHVLPDLAPLKHMCTQLAAASPISWVRMPQHAAMKKLAFKIAPKSTAL